MVATRDPLTLIAGNIDYWQYWVSKRGSHNVAELDGERENLFRAAEYGLRYTTTAIAAATLAADLFKLVEQRYYWRDWLNILQQATQFTHLSPDLTITLHNHQGLLLHRLQEHLLAVEAHANALHLTTVHQYPKKQLVTHGHLSNAYYRAGDYEQAQQHVEAAQQLLQQQPEIRIHDQATIHHCAGMIALARGLLDEAITSFQQAGRLFAQARDILYEARATSNLGVAYQRHGRLTDANMAYHHAAALLAPTHFELAKVQNWTNLGAYYTALENDAQALAWFQKADSQPLWASADYRQQALVAHNLGYVFINLNRPDEARIYLERAQNLWLTIEDKRSLGNTLIELGRMHSKLMDTELAIHYFEEALCYFALFPEDKWVQSCAAEAAEKLQQVKGKDG